MSFGFRIRSAGGSVLLDSNNYSIRMVYRQEIGSISQNQSITITGFDAAKGAVFITAAGNAYAHIPFYTISGSTITFGRSGSSSTSYTLYAVMFS
jgi:hypothetical protein